MKKLTISLALIVIFAFCSFGQKESNKKPVIDQTRPQINQRVADGKKRSGKSVDFDKTGQPVADPQRRKHVFCRVLGPEEWGLLFPDIPGEYGGTVCIRK